MEMAVCNAEPGLQKKKRKQKKRGNASKGDHRGLDPSECNASKDPAVPQESPVKICLNLEEEVDQAHSKVSEENGKREKKEHDDLQYGEASGISVRNVLNVKVIEKEDGTSISPNAELCSADGKENSLNPEETDGKGPSVIKREDGCTEIVDHLAQQSHVDMQMIKKRKRRRKRRRSLESPKHVGTTEVVDGVLLEEVSTDCTVSENAEFISAKTRDNPMVFADPHGSADGENSIMIKKDNDCLKTKDCLPQPCNDDTHGIKKRERRKGRKKRKFADTRERSLEFDMVDGKKDAPLKFLNDVETTSLHESSTTTETAKNVLLAEVSNNGSVGELPSEIKARMDMDSSCKILEDEINTQTKKQTVPHVSACDAAKDDVGMVLENNSYSLITNSSIERDAIGCSKKKLLILDVNGLLVDFVPYFPDGFTPDIIISKKAVFKRPFCDDFLQFCFERFEVGVWSSRTWRNLDMLVKFLMRDFRHKLLFCWDQSHCTTTRFTTIENNRKPLVLKELRKIWENLEPNLPWKEGEYNESNTLLLDDSPYKALRNPANTAVFPTTYRYTNSEDTALGPGGDLRVYLEGVSIADNVKKYVEQNPFGQQPISESDPSWKFYCKIINSEGQ